MTHMKYRNAKFSVVLGGISFRPLWLHGIEEAHEGDVKASPWYPTNNIRHIGLVMAPRQSMLCIWFNVPPLIQLGMLMVGPQQHCRPHGLCMDSTMTGGLFRHSILFVYLFIFGLKALTITAKRCLEHVYGNVGCGLQEIETIGFEECLKMRGKTLICRVQFSRRVNTPNWFAILWVSRPCLSTYKVVCAAPDRCGHIHWTIYWSYL